MNKNEECLLKFLKNPGRLDKTLEELQSFIFSAKNNIINKELSFGNHNSETKAAM